MRFLNLSIVLFLSGFLLSCDSSKSKIRSGPRSLEILFLGHNSEHHNAAAYMPMLASNLSKEGIHFTYTDNPDDLNADNLNKYDGLMIYANHEKITPEQEKALLGFVEKGRGFIPVHCASFCFQNSPEYISLVGGQFLKHKTDTFVAKIIKKDHPIVKSLNEFSTWDETYVHDKIAKDITVLMERVEEDHHEPWTWIKEHGKGRVFYTAYGHDERTWNNPGFHQLIKEGILWAVGDDAKKDWETFKNEMPKLVYRDEENIPNYEKRDPAPKFQEPLSPEESKKLIQIPVGFDLELFASEPDIINPIAMEWDEKGRLWVVETVDYPNSVRDDKGAGDDRIKICEDTDGDGKADNFKVFAENLNIPTSIVFANGGIIISQAPHFIFLKDTDGDDVADVKKIIIDGWGTFDTHAGPSNLKYGFDNQIWGTVGYSGFEGTIAGENRVYKQGVYRFKPDVSSFEFMTSTSNNTWGLGFTENNDVFASTANNTHSVFMAIPNKVVDHVKGVQFTGSIKLDGHYAMHPITQNVRQVDVFGGFTAAAGHNFYTARAFPKKYWNQVAFVCEPTGHLVHMARLEKEGAGFIEKDSWNLFASADEWVSPVEAKVGPDGAVWVLDWYNFIVQHNPTPTPERGGYAAVNGKGNAYENPLRDKTHGRIWRVVSQEAKSVDRITLSKDEPDDLIKAFKNDNLFWRLTAQRLLVERGNQDVLPDLYDLVKKDQVDEFGYNHAATHALWTIDGLGALTKDDQAEAVVVGALKHKSPGVRKAAIQILSKSSLSDDVVIKSNILQDPDPNTRLAAIVSLMEISPSAALGEILFKMSLEESVNADHWLAKAVYASAGQHNKGFMDAFMKANPGYKIEAEEIKKREAVEWDDASWKPMDLPQNFEKAGLNIDGMVWFRHTVELPANAAGKKATLSLGPVDDSDVTYVNGVKVGSIERKRNEKRLYEIPARTLKAGKNIIAIRVEDFGGNGGLYGKEEELFLDVSGKKISLAGPWRYEVEKEYNPRDVFGNKTLAEVFMNTYLNPAAVEEPVAATTSGQATVIKIGVIKNEMKYDIKTFTVEAGKPVEIVFENPDFMQHNLVITQIGALKTVGAAADKLASQPNGAEMNYVPAIPEVLFSTKLVNPQQTVKLNFIAPTKEGEYPFVCTFPGHWSIMNGVMKVVAKKTAL
ncbi:PVC-type heme-binding CxxCH protein [Chryseolinea sp. H1M3-3]|uniref:PVC-type heme-binding CxxCH protein n=1 Tax=Chryseolinea sp. H1M3-3 TaxID=3034144 RepID=UPI0023EAD787|nr:PVC-type heme-binding CxxCH protein [Chryseolinea sp. H1M3-3]